MVAAQPPFLSAIAADMRNIVRLGSPLMVNNLAVAAMGLADALMAGRLGSTALASVAVGVAYWNLFLLAGLGLLMAMSPIVAHLCGAGRQAHTGRYLGQALWLAAFATVPLLAGLFAVRSVLTLIGSDPIVLDSATGYVWAMAAGLPGLMGYFALRFVSEGIGRTTPIMCTALLGLTVNVAGNWVFMYGHFGAPALGAVGTGVASAITMWVLCGTLLLQMRRQRFYRPYALFARIEWPNRVLLSEILALAAPICGSVLAEGTLFVAAGLMMSTLGAVAIAAHQIALSYASVMFMIPLAMCSATTIHAGHAIGRGDVRAGRRAGYAGIALCGGVMACSALLILFLNDRVASLYSGDPAVASLGARLLLMAGVFQVSDGLQVGASGALRGFKDARVPLLLTLVSYWLIGFPLAFGLGIVARLGPVYAWLGLAIGLSAAALALNLRYLAVSRRALATAQAAHRVVPAP